MFRILLITLLYSGLFAQAYRWPIKASQSLSATFCEYRDGHLHAGVDIKTWGEMEVPCVAIADGYIESIVVSYHGYGRGLFLRLEDGNLAVYGHLELFTDKMEALVHEAQNSREKYYTRFRFQADEHPVRAGQVIGFSGTSGTEHPHLHFELRDSSNTVFNPQIFYSGVRDTKRPVLDEILLVPKNSQTKINNSRLPVRIDVKDENPITTTGPFYSLINAHDRANGTYNKYSLYRADLFMNDSLAFAYRFDQLPHSMSDSIDVVYPGVRGKQNWRFMSMFRIGDPNTFPFMKSGKTGLLDPDGIATLRYRLSDVKRNITSAEFTIIPEFNESWSVQEKDSFYFITRSYPEGGYERFEFYSSTNDHLPVAQTFYRLNSTTWRIVKSELVNGIRASSTRGKGLQWIIPPTQSIASTFEHQWTPYDPGFILRLESTEAYTYPLAYRILTEEGHFEGELTQVSERTAESDIIPLPIRAQGRSVQLLSGQDVLDTHELKPLNELRPGDSLSLQWEVPQASLNATNPGEASVFLRIDTTRGEFEGQDILGIQIHSIGENEFELRGELTFKHALTSSGSSLFTPGKKKSWKRLGSLDTLGYSHMALSKSGPYFLISDLEAPRIQPVKPYERIRKGDRLVFKLSENTKRINYRESLPSAMLDQKRFYPDYNPLRKELSFHVPQGLARGEHEFSVTLTDYSGNRRDYSYTFTLGH
ncbi:MAG: M23 family metallopeptidase [Candidatus Marinimicrobia bacterium]|nr:M23 family metallopeptidase [Candidatus Neomarinimicrobiota bacterium]MCF7851258.1 M23 family metallopeptidase [Candidatus Neomarinimicrobiota bacterium]